jgi:hypothetical protein
MAFAPNTYRDWKVYRSSQSGFSARYPRNWHTLPPLGQSLDIVSFPLAESEKGSIIPFGGARIVVVRGQDRILDREVWIRANTNGIEAKSRSDVTLRRASSGEEFQATKVVFEWWDGQKQYETVDCYFEISEDPFHSRLTYWKADSSAPGYRQVQDGVVGSIILSKIADPSLR